MHAQLELLLELQDLHTQKRSLREEGHVEIEAEMFDVDIDAALATLDDKLVELEENLEPQVRDRYRDLVRAVQRAVIPVISGICFGCFVAVPTAHASAAKRNQTLGVCAHCGRFLYYVD